MNILIVRVSSLGDVVHNMPMVADILRHYPNANIDWVVEEAYTSLVRLNPSVRHVIPFALRRWRKSLLAADTRTEMREFYQALRRESYDIVFDTQGLFKTSLVMRMARLASGGKRVGLANATEGSGYESISRVFHDKSVPVGAHTHAVLRARLVAAAAFGYPIEGPADFNLHLSESAQAARPTWLPSTPYRCGTNIYGATSPHPGPLPEGEGENRARLTQDLILPDQYAVFFHGTARAAKQWTVSHWLQIAQGLAARGLPVLLPWGSAEEQRAAQQLAAQMTNAQVLPKLSMMEAVTLAQRAALVIGVDTGLTHIAAAFTRPTIELYCDSPRWKTQGDWSPSIINLGDLGMPPSVAEVEAAVATLLGPVDAAMLCQA